ncbi:MAG: dihydroorotase [Candidatus Makaraimicrobium thalassicum]|nr:MAG: dihydroorotase [Candidatus Omnitrophota bacterium]
MSILIKGGRIIDPMQKKDSPGDILIEKGEIARIGGAIKAEHVTIIHAEGKIVAPGFVDMHTHLREPGREDQETIETGLSAAVSGGFTTVSAMPNTEPPCDSQAHVKFLLERAMEAGLANILPVGTITKKREGERITEMGELKDAGCLAVSDDGDAVGDAGLLRRAMEYASMVGLLVISHCEDKALSAGGVMNEGYRATVLGLAPIPAEAENTIIERDIQLAELTGTRLHIAHVSTSAGVEIIRGAKTRGVRVTAEVTPHHFTLTDEALKTYDTNLKVNPPLRSAQDVEALKKGLKDGTIDVIATDHAPHLENEKEKEFDYAPFGMIGLETALPLSAMGLIDEGYLDWPGLIRKLSTNPSSILGYDRGTLKQGAAADIVIIDPGKEWSYTREGIRSRSSNSPFIGWRMRSAVTDVIAGGRIVVSGGKIV